MAESGLDVLRYKARCYCGADLEPGDLAEVADNGYICKACLEAMLESPRAWSSGWTRPDKAKEAIRIAWLLDQKPPAWVEADPGELEQEHVADGEGWSVCVVGSGPWWGVMVTYDHPPDPDIEWHQNRRAALADASDAADSHREGEEEDFSGNFPN